MHVEIIMLHLNIIILRVGVNKSHVKRDMLHVDMIYLACQGQKYATIQANFCCSFYVSIIPGRPFH